MKKILLASIASVVASVCSFGATYSGTCGNVDLGTAGAPVGSVTIACPSFTVLSGEQLSSYSLTFFGSYAGASTEVSDSARFTFNIVSNGAFSGFGALANPFTTSASPIPGPEPLSQIGGASASTNAVTALQTGLIAGASGSATFQTLFGFVPSSNFNFTLIYNAASVTMPSSSAVPEPATVALIGVGMIGMVAVARRRR